MSVRCRQQEERTRGFGAQGREWAGLQLPPPHAPSPSGPTTILYKCSPAAALQGGGREAVPQEW
jgi:hypothetical protein